MIDSTSEVIGGTTVAGSKDGVLVNGSTFTGGISNAGRITGLRGIEVGATSAGAVTVFSGGITNSGTVSGGTQAAIVAADASSFSGGITNSGGLVEIGERSRHQARWNRLVRRRQCQQLRHDFGLVDE